METILNVVRTVNSYLTDYALLILLVGTGLFFTIRTGFVQVRHFGEGMRNVFGKIKFHGGHHKGGMSSFQALTTAVAAQVGTGNIIGACGAILIGGPGAIFWMWVIAFFGMATIYSEAVLAQKTRVINPDGTVSGGPVYYIKKAFKGKFGKFLAGFFAVAIVLALGFMGSMVQSNSISEAISNASGVDGWIIGIIIAILCALIFIGGVKRVASVTEKLVPIMAVVYLLGGFIILCCRITSLPETFALIFEYAFIPNAIIGGSVGYALKEVISQGAKRGLFSNEAGMGSTPHAHAMANVKSAHEQGTVAMIGVFIDTFIVLTMTGLIVISILYAGDGVLANGMASYNGEEINKANMLSFAIASLFNGSDVGNMIAAIFVAVCLTFFAFSTIISWNLFGKINFNYLFGKKATVVYSVISIIFIFLGSVLSNDLVWELTDFFNYLMVIPNVMALIALSNVVVQEVKEHKKKKRDKNALQLDDNKQSAAEDVSVSE